MWKNVNINKQNIVAETGRSTLIKCPNKSDYSGYSFWHPAKLVRDGKHGYAVSLGYNETFTFRLIKYGKGKWNSRDVIDEITIGVEEFEEMFDVINENIVPSKDNDSYVIVEEPTKIDREIVVAECLKNN